MKIIDITEEMFPLYLIEIEVAKDVWSQWVCEPFSTKEEAEKRRSLIVENHHFQVRIGNYTKDHWRLDLINEVMKNQDAMHRALSILRNSTLLDLLK